MKELRTLYCMVDGKPIPLDRLRRGRGAVSCSNECGKIVRETRRQIVNEKECRACGRPSTQEERQRFIAWRKSEGTVKKVGRPRTSATVKKVKEAPPDAVQSSS